MNRSVRDSTIDLMTDSGSDSSYSSESDYPPVKKKKALQRNNKTVSSPAKLWGKKKRYKQKYRVMWENEYPWVRHSEVDEFHFFCVLCEKSYLGGITEITKHESSYKHSSAALKSQGEFTPQAFGKPISRSRPKYPIFFGTVPEEKKDTPKTRSQALTNQKAKLSFESKLMKIEKEEESSTAVKNIPNKKATGGVIVHPHSVPSTSVPADAPTGEVVNQVTIHTVADENVITEDGTGEVKQSSPPSPPSAQVPSVTGVPNQRLKIFMPPKVADGYEKETRENIPIVDFYGAAQDPDPTSASSAQELFDSMIDQQTEQSAKETTGGESARKNIDDSPIITSALGLTPEEIANHIRASQGKPSRSYKQRYRKAWEAEFSWVEKSNVDEFHFRCKACLRDYYGGLSEIMNHGATAKHCVSEYKRLAMLNDMVMKPSEVFTEEIAKVCSTDIGEDIYAVDDGETSTYERSVYDKPSKYETSTYQRSSYNKSKPTSSLHEHSIDSVRWSKQLVDSELRLIKRRAEIVEVEMRTALLNEHTAMLRKKVAAAELKLKEGELGKLGLVFRKKSGRK